MLVLTLYVTVGCYRVFYVHISYIYNECVCKLATPLETLLFCCSCQGVECRKELCIPGPLSLLRWRREQEGGLGELALSW